MKKILIYSGIIITALTALVSCKEENNKLVVGGSTSVQPLMEHLSEAYTKTHKQEVEVQGGGSTVGFTQTESGVFDMGMLSRELKSSEAPKVESTEIALDGIVVIVNKNNAIKSITMEQLKAIYTGKITNWKQLGGKDLTINVISRESGSGTRGAFEEIVKFKSSELIKNAQIQNSTGAVETLIKSNQNAIGYISLGSLKNTVKAVNINNVEATVENIRNKKYKLVRPFMIVWKKDNKNSDKFRKFILSNEGQKIVNDNKYISVK